MGSRNRTPTTGPLASQLAAGVTALVLFAHAADAQTPAPPAEEEQTRRYRVELIVFAYDESVPSGNEVFVPDEPPEERIPEYSDRLDDPAFPDGESRSYGDAGAAPFPEELPDDPLSGGDPAGDPLEDRPPARQWIELQLHDEQQPRMNEIYGRLVNIDAYHPLMRAAWTQTTHGKDAAPAIHLQSLGGAPTGLDGSITLYAGRFVHLVLDLALDAGPAEAGVYGNDGRRADRDGDNLFRAPVRYRLAEDRIMRMGEIRYFDHPRFGVIARVTAPEAGEDEGEPEAIAGGD